MTDRLCIIPVRSGSKGLAHKNIRDFLGKPLVSHSVDHAIASGMFATVAVTSDSDHYLDIARKSGANLCIKRPAELASDMAGTLPAVIHALQMAEAEGKVAYDTVVLLQATTPLRSSEHIQQAIAQLEGQDFDSVVSVAKAKNSPYFTLLEYQPEAGSYALSKKLPQDVLRRQDAPEVFQLNGSIYVWRKTQLLKQQRALCERTGIYEMPQLNSIDIDTEEDWKFAELAASLLSLKEQYPNLAKETR